MSRFESNLLTAIDAEQDEQSQWVLRLSWAAYRVRIGDSKAARSVVSEARKRHEKNYSAQIFSHINFVEGLCEFFDNGIELAMPKLVRCNALSTGCPSSDDLPVLVKAWLAGIYRNTGNWRLMKESLIAALACHGAMSDEACCRVSLVVADAFQETESYEKAGHWYSSARFHALASGDDAALSAILYNRSAIRLFNLRIDEICGIPLGIDECRIALEAASAENYTRYIRDNSMQWGFDLMKGQLMLLKGEYANALLLLDSERVHHIGSQWPAVDLVRQADLIRCKAALGQYNLAQAEALVEQSWVGLVGKSTWGDKAVAAFSLSEGLRSVGSSVSPFYLTMAKEALEKFRGERHSESLEVEDFVRSGESSKISALRALPG